MFDSSIENINVIRIYMQVRNRQAIGEFQFLPPVKLDMFTSPLLGPLWCSGSGYCLIQSGNFVADSIPSNSKQAVASSCLE